MRKAVKALRTVERMALLPAAVVGIAVGIAVAAVEIVAAEEWRPWLEEASQES